MVKKFFGTQKNKSIVIQFPWRLIHHLPSLIWESLATPYGRMCWWFGADVWINGIPLYKTMIGGLILVVVALAIFR